MAKILISSLGMGAKKDGSYSKAKYKIDNEVYEASFISSVICSHLQIEKLFLIGTSKSIWDEAYSVFSDNSDEEKKWDLISLQAEGKVTEESLGCLNEAIDQNLNNIGSKCFIIDYGIDENGLWKNFESFLSIVEYLNDGDELYLDITHSFRSLAMMSFTMIQFAKSIADKKINIKAVYYGMLEYQSENIDKIAPIVDLSILVRMQEWIKAIDAIKKYSDFDPLVEILEQEGIENKVENTFIELNNAIDMANMAAIQKFVKNAGKKIKAIEETGNKVVKLLAPEIVKLVEQLNHERTSDFQFALAKWYFNNKNYAMSYMALAEAIVTKNCELKGLDRNDLSKENQERVKSVQFPYDKNFQTKYSGSISDIRNNVAHQLKDREESAGRDIQKLKIFLEEYALYFKL
jgi:CRISPR-associated Csx2 family protein